MTSSGRGSSCNSTCRMLDRMLQFDRTIPFGSPVVPEVKRTAAVGHSADRYAVQVRRFSGARSASGGRGWQQLVAVEVMSWGGLSIGPTCYDVA